MKIKSAQTLVEYILIFVVVGVAVFSFVAGFNFDTIKNYVFLRPSNSINTSQIEIEPMTKGD